MLREISCRVAKMCYNTETGGASVGVSAASASEERARSAGGGASANPIACNEGRGEMYWQSRSFRMEASVPRRTFADKAVSF